MALGPVMRLKELLRQPQGVLRSVPQPLSVSLAFDNTPPNHVHEQHSTPTQGPPPQRRDYPKPP
jgi:hypothetical protein